MEIPRIANFIGFDGFRVIGGTGAMFFVVVTVKGKGSASTENVVGVAHWNRIGSDACDVGYGLRWWDPRKLAFPFAKFYISVASYFRPNRAADPSKEDVVERSYPCTEKCWQTAQRSRCWNLDHLGVHPDYQLHGFGQLLVRWGLDRANIEGVAASVVSADPPEGFYEKSGFQWSGRWVSEGNGNPLQGVPGGKTYFRDVGSARPLSGD